MVNLEQSTVYFMSVTYSPEQKEQFYRAFSLLEGFGSKYYEDKYNNLITQVNAISKEDMQDTFNKLVIEDILEIFNMHDIGIDLYNDPTLEELIGLGEALLLVQNLDNYQTVKYLLERDTGDLEKIQSILTYYSHIPEYRVLEVINSVSNDLILSIEKMVEDREEQIDPIEDSYKKSVDLFFKFTGEYTPLGKELYLDGYVNLTLKQVLDLLPFELPEYIGKKLDKSKAEATIDILSLLMIAVDSYQTPLLHFTKNSEALLYDTGSILTIKNTLTKMITDYEQFCEVEIKREKAND